MYEVQRSRRWCYYHKGDRIKSGELVASPQNASVSSVATFIPVQVQASRCVMLRLVAMWCVVVSLYALQRTWQIMQVLPLAAQTGPIDHNGLNNLSKWQLDEPPNVNSTGHLVFETINSLLQHWPNTRMRTGESFCYQPDLTCFRPDDSATSAHITSCTHRS